MLLGVEALSSIMHLLPETRLRPPFRSYLSTIMKKRAAMTANSGEVADFKAELAVEATAPRAEPCVVVTIAPVLEPPVETAPPVVGHKTPAEVAVAPTATTEEL